MYKRTHTHVCVCFFMKIMLDYNYYLFIIMISQYNYLLILQSIFNCALVRTSAVYCYSYVHQRTSPVIGSHR